MSRDRPRPGHDLNLYLDHSLIDHSIIKSTKYHKYQSKNKTENTIDYSNIINIESIRKFHKNIESNVKYGRKYYKNIESIVKYGKKDCKHTRSIARKFKVS